MHMIRNPECMCDLDWLDTATKAYYLGMQHRVAGPLERVVFNSGSVRIGAFRCGPRHPAFRDSGPAQNYFFVFPRTAVEIQHEHERAFVANPNIVTFYNKGQAYQRNVISVDGDRCDWFALDLEIIRDVVCAFDPALESHPEHPFRFARGWSDGQTYLLQRRIFERAVTGFDGAALEIEESVVGLLERVVELAYTSCNPKQLLALSRRQRDIVHHVEHLLSEQWEQELTLQRIAREAGVSVYHLCRMFRRVTGTTLHQYRQNLRLRWSLEGVIESRQPLVEIALDAGFSSHSHFTSSFHREFSQTPSFLRMENLS
jgi:AraC family transcriptional regulator